VTQQEWKEVEEKLKSFYQIVELRCDNYKISLILERMDQFKNAIVVYVNGKIKGEWMTSECEESRRFFRKVTKSILSPKQKKLYNKMSKKLKNELGMKLTYSYYVATWTSFRSLKKHLIEQNQSIELVRQE